MTSGAGGIGAACAHALVADGAAVVPMGRRHDALERTQRQLTDAVPGSRVANPVLFLASDEARFVNGAELRIDNAQRVSSL
ncbi:hypothetical protein B7G54_02110 [Burkholderia puraquae]|uniref:Uncharacterized protein n=1 Tax=Burkholderia puraquae TaxID=1904757 RepID=A0A1X1PQD6_9BURK|nr:hypothetical protein B7G54_02110 [Burkholderia puraquae]